MRIDWPTGLVRVNVQDPLAFLLIGSSYLVNTLTLITLLAPAFNLGLFLKLARPQVQAILPDSRDVESHFFNAEQFRWT